MGERQPFDDCELIGEGDALEDVASFECTPPNSLEVFVEEDAFEGGEFDERLVFDDFELVGESDTREGVASLKCCPS